VRALNHLFLFLGYLFVHYFYYTSRVGGTCLTAADALPYKFGSILSYGGCVAVGDVHHMDDSVDFDHGSGGDQLSAAVVP
jgi:hypothetical protein